MQKIKRNSFFSLILLFSTISCNAQVGSAWAWDSGKISNNGNIQLRLSDGSGTQNLVQNPTGAIAKVNQSAITQPPTIIIQATASLPIKSLGDGCTQSTVGSGISKSANEGAAITNDRTTLLSCQAGIWKAIGSGGSSASICGLGLSKVQIPIFCTTTSQKVYDSSSNPMVQIGILAGNDGVGYIIVDNNPLNNPQPSYGCNGIITGATSTTDGITNTSKIIASGCGSTAAARCVAKGVGWFLPSLSQAAMVNAAIGNMGYVPVMSSTENNANQTFYIWSSSGVGYGDWSKLSAQQTFCVRYF